MTPPHHIFGLLQDEVREIAVAAGMPRFRADQLLEWVYGKHIVDPAQMTNLSKAHIATVSTLFRFTSADIVRHQVATDGVQKLLMQWQDAPTGAARETSATISLPMAPDSSAVSGHRQDAGIDRPTGFVPDARRQTECVLIPATGEEREDGSASQRRTACISSQVGCPVGCRFCASGLGGLDGDLTAGRIVEQVWRLATLPGVGRVTHVVFMGMGEPLANFSQVVRALQIMNAEWGLGISARRITVSTVGLPAQMRRLADLEIPVTLAISLHAPNDELRRRLIPWAEYVTIDQLLEAGDYYFEKTGREITLEYILLGGVNDRPEHARELASVAKRLRANVNLIRYNEVKGLPFDRPGTDEVRGFQNVLREARVNCHIRASRGRDIAAACGQLRHEEGTTVKATNP